MHKILIVEDDATIAAVLAKELGGWGYKAMAVTDFAKVMETFCEYSPQLVILDLSLPHRSGFHWCGEIRKVSSVPIIFISSAADNMNMVTALHQGADDFIAKPFDLAVLVAKVQAILRRSYSFGGASGESLFARGAALNVNSMQLTAGDSAVELTKNEFRILQLLMENAGRVTPREAIMQKLWDDESFIDDNTLTVNINRLRKKLEAAGLANFIITKKGEGYMVPREEENSGA